jgi:hypothetical protein
MPRAPTILWLAEPFLPFSVRLPYRNPVTLLAALLLFWSCFWRIDPLFLEGRFNQRACFNEVLLSLVLNSEHPTRPLSFIRVSLRDSKEGSTQG